MAENVYGLVGWAQRQRYNCRYTTVDTQIQIVPARIRGVYIWLWPQPV